MREKIEAGDKVDLFASADMGHVLKLRKDGRAAEAVMFTRNQLCAFAKPEAKLASVTFADRLLGPVIKLGTSTPKGRPGRRLYLGDVRADRQGASRLSPRSRPRRRRSKAAQPRRIPPSPTPLQPALRAARST
jgi:hypothetical protein